MRLLFTIQYLGTRYAGWQTQANATGVQQVIEEALATIYGGPVTLHGAGRTDAGVHAEAQRAHVDAPFEIPVHGLLRGVNDLLPEDIRIIAAEEVPTEFHARFSAHAKTYLYRIWNDEVADVFHSATHAHVGQPLDAGVMHEAAQALCGKHDFRAFTVANPEVSSTERTIAAMTVTRHGPVISIAATADGFLRYMMRRIAGSLIEVGRGKLPADALRRSLQPSLEPARWTAPAKGLTLHDIRYGSAGNVVLTSPLR